MVTVLALLGVLAVLFAAAVLSTREEGLLAEVAPDEPDVPLPEQPMTPEDVSGLRFSLAARGYRMSQVDAALERLAAELADRDRRIGLLEAAAEGAQEAGPVREATVEDLPAPVAPPAAQRTANWSDPSSVPEFPVIDAPEHDGPSPP